MVVVVSAVTAIETLAPRWQTNSNELYGDGTAWRSDFGAL